MAQIPKPIPPAIADHVYVDRSIPHGLRWKQPRSRSVKVGDPAGCRKSHGAYMVQFQYDYYLNHRVMYFLETGKDPGVLEVDHVWHDDNSGPLRLVTHQQNQFYRRARKGSRSKHKGVTFVKGKWRAGITKDGVNTTLGHFDAEEEAAAAYNIAARKLFGEFALLNDLDEHSKSTSEGDFND